MIIFYWLSRINQATVDLSVAEVDCTENDVPSVLDDILKLPRGPLLLDWTVKNIEHVEVTFAVFTVATPLTKVSWPKDAELVIDKEGVDNVLSLSL